MPIDESTRDWLLEHHKDAYEFQSERSDKIRDTVSFLSGLLSILGGGILYVAFNYPHSWRGASSLLFYGPISLSLLLFIVAVCQILFCIARGYKYSYILSPKQLQEYVEALVHYSDSCGKPLDIMDDLKRNMMRRYCEGATHNLNVNTRRSPMLVRATQLSAVSFLCLLLALPFFFIHKSSEKPDSMRVTITEPIKVQR